MLIDTFLAYIAQNRLFTLENRILVAVSGGLDSIALLDMLHKAGFQTGIAHVNFQLRGAESEGDEAFVRALADCYQVPIFVTRFDTQGYAEAHTRSIQVSARELRYAWFADILANEGYDGLVTAHHANDNLETILHRWARGTGIMGLQGIPARATFGAGKWLARPLLGTAQADIKLYAMQNNLTWREDSSNAEDKYTRNLIRHQVVPVLQAINPNLEQTFQATLERVKGYAAHFEQSLAELKAKICTQKHQTLYIELAPLLREVAGKVFLAELLQPYQFMYEKVQLIWQKATENAIGTLFLSSTHSLVIDREALVLTALSALPAPAEKYALAYDTPCLPTPYFTLQVAYKPYSAEAHILVQNANKAFLDVATLEFPLTVRLWEAGDFFYPLGMQGRKKKVSDFLNDQKVPRNLKSAVWVLCAGKDIVWVIGHRIAHPYRLTAHTTEVIEIVLEF